MSIKIFAIIGEDSPDGIPRRREDSEDSNMMIPRRSEDCPDCKYDITIFGEERTLRIGIKYLQYQGEARTVRIANMQ